MRSNTFVKPINIVIIIFSLILIGYEAFIILKRNRTIDVKGTDDFFVVMVLLLVVLVIFPFSENELLEEAIRNMLVIVTVISSLFIRRGLSDKGLVKICFIIPWENITSIVVDESKSSSKAIFHFYLNSGFITKWKLQFGLRQVEQALDMCATYIKDVKVQPELFQKIQKYKKMF